MMKLVYLKVEGYHNYKDDTLEIDFRLNKRVRNDIVIDELDEIQEGLYLGNTYPFIGPNSSGKTTTFNLLNSVLHVMFGEEKVELHFPTIAPNGTLLIDFYYIISNGTDNSIINNKTKLGKNEFGQVYVVEEKIYERKLVKTDRQSSLLNFKEKDLKYISSDSVYYNQSFLHNKRFLNGAQYFIHYHRTNEDMLDMYNNYFVTYFKNMINETTIDLFENVIKLLDSNVESIKLANTQDSFILKLKRNNEITTSLENLSTILSDGTRRGARLFFTAMMALKVGGVLIIDEIELHLHKALAIELISIFQSKSLNPNHATLIFSTHYTELLDIFNRNDVIHVVKNENGIENYNLSNVIDRNDVLISKAYLNNLIDSSPSYTQKMKVRKLLRAK